MCFGLYGLFGLSPYVCSQYHAIPKTLHPQISIYAMSINVLDLTPSYLHHHHHVTPHLTMYPEVQVLCITKRKV